MAWVASAVAPDSAQAVLMEAVRTVSAAVAALAVALVQLTAVVAVAVTARRSGLCHRFTRCQTPKLALAAYSFLSGHKAFQADVF